MNEIKTYSFDSMSLIREPLVTVTNMQMTKNSKKQFLFVVGKLSG